MLALGLTGGIGCGKSAVADLLVARGAILIDADLIAREVVEPGQPAHDALLARFGEGILAADGTIDRPALAAATFGDPDSLAALNAITHPAIGIEMLRRLGEQQGTDHVVVLAIPLLRAEHRVSMNLDAVVVVDCPFDVARWRLVDRRGMDPADAEARIVAQPTREQRLEGADYVVDNSGDLDALGAEVDRLWEWVQARRPEKAAGEAQGPA
jgi:dephospho-CoA kinase